jgi:hypothetical protein
MASSQNDTRSAHVVLLSQGLLVQAVATLVATRKATAATAVPAYAIALSIC